MIQQLCFNLDNLTATLDVREDGKEVRYVIDLAADRETCSVARDVFAFQREEVTGDEESGFLIKVNDPIEHKEWVCTLSGLKDDQGSFPHHVIWAARGMWGIPLEFGQKAGQEEEDVMVL